MATCYRSVSPGNIVAPKNPLPMQAGTIFAQIAMNDCSKLLHCVTSPLGMPPEESSFIFFQRGPDLSRKCCLKGSEC